MGNGFDEAWYRERQLKMARVKAAVLGQPQATPAASTAPAALVQERHRRAHNRPEQELQKQVAAFLDWALPSPWRWWHTPNERGTRKNWEQALFKALGVKPGIGDCIVVGPAPMRMIWIELKSGKESLSAPQREWRDWCHEVAIPHFVCRSLDEVIAALTSCGVQLKARVS